MSDQNFLNESDIDTLINLLLRSQQSRTREALCLNIGIDPKRLSFLRDSSDSDFFLLLITYLNEIGDQEAVCKLCCKELGLIFHKGTYALFLNDLTGKLKCNPQISPIEVDEPCRFFNLFNQLVKNKLITGGTILIIGLVLFILNKLPIPINNGDSSSSPTDLRSLEIVPKEYTHLQSLLASSKWKEADQETQDVMLKLAGREKEGFLRDPDYDNPADFLKISCPALKEIDLLWVKYSNKRFGFSVQKDIWKEKPDLKVFYERIGWTVNQNRKNYDNLTFSLNAPLGHLPARGEYSHGRGGWVYIDCM